MNKGNCALKLVDEKILYYDARSKKYQKFFLSSESEGRKLAYFQLFWGAISPFVYYYQINFKKSVIHNIQYKVQHLSSLVATHKTNISMHSLQSAFIGRIKIQEIVPSSFATTELVWFLLAEQVRG